jgi:hypothetical protein
LRPLTFNFLQLVGTGGQNRKERKKLRGVSLGNIRYLYEYENLRKQKLGEMWNWKRRPRHVMDLKSI